MRISDWSSDVCSADLRRAVDERGFGDHLAARGRDTRHRFARRQAGGDDILDHQHLGAGVDGEAAAQFEGAGRALDEDRGLAERAAHFVADDDARSEEHTSELQSLMRISYAVFCLKKKKKYNNQNNTQRN